MTYVQSFLKFFLFSVGLFPVNNVKSKTLISLIICLHSVLTIGEINAFIHTPKSIHRYEIAYQVLCYIYIGLTQYISWRNRKFLLHICDRLEGNCWQKFAYENITLRAENTFKKIVDTFALMYFITMAIYSSAPWMNFFVKKMDYNDPLSYPMPYWFAILQIDSVYEYFLMNTVQTILCTMAFTSYASNFGFIICILINIKAHLKEFEERTLQLGKKMNILHDTSRGYAYTNNVQHEEILLEELKEFIEYKQLLYV